MVSIDSLVAAMNRHENIEDIVILNRYIMLVLFVNNLATIVGSVNNGRLMVQYINVYKMGFRAFVNTEKSIVYAASWVIRIPVIEMKEANRVKHLSIYIGQDISTSQKNKNCL